ESPVAFLIAALHQLNHQPDDKGADHIRRQNLPPHGRCSARTGGSTALASEVERKATGCGRAHPADLGLLRAVSNQVNRSYHKYDRVRYKTECEESGLMTRHI